jgi:hypothetical protein
VFWVPSYGRILVPLRPVRDDAGNRIGFWRVVLPRTSWMDARVEGRADDADWSGLPLDLVPDLPLGHWLVGRVLDLEPELARRLSQLGAGRLEVELGYRSLVKPYRQNPEHAFDRSRVEVRIVAGPGSELMLTADVQLDGDERRPVLVALAIEGRGDGALEALADAVEAELRPDARPSR